MTREQKLGLIWRYTHPDYRLICADGVPAVLALRQGGTSLVPLDRLTDDEITQKLPYAIRCENDRLARSGRGPSPSDTGEYL
jgi:hypothetical protein